MFVCMKEIDTYLKTRAPVTFVSELRSKLQVCLSTTLCCL